MYELRLTKEQIETIQSLCDLALKVGGLQNLQKVLEILELLTKAKDLELAEMAKEAQNKE